MGQGRIGWMVLLLGPMLLHIVDWVRPKFILSSWTEFLFIGPGLTRVYVLMSKKKNYQFYRPVIYTKCID